MRLARRPLLAAFAGTLAAPRLASAQGFPSRPIRIVVPFTPSMGAVKLGQPQPL